jgi:ribokinase
VVSRARLTVLGSLNMDISVTVPRLPRPGATVLGGAAAFAPGGKGANQAVAAARLGASVLMAGCVGDDDFGRTLRSALVAEGVGDEAVRALPGVPTGLAMITVDEAGENMITVAPGANREAGAAEIAAIADAGGDALVISAEVPVAAIGAALAAGDYRLRVLNLAPAPPEAADIVAAGVDWLVVNESEAAAVLGRPVDGLTGPAGAVTAAADLARAGARNAVVTAGSAGAGYSGQAGDLGVPGFAVRPVDSVGAGDTFVGALAVALAAGVPPRDALVAAAAAGAAAVTRPGTQAGMPRPADVLAATGHRWPVRVPEPPG